MLISNLQKLAHSKYCINTEERNTGRQEVYIAVNVSSLVLRRWCSAGELRDRDSFDTNVTTLLSDVPQLQT